jgi:hypothetical protein
MSGGNHSPFLKDHLFAFILENAYLLTSANRFNIYARKNVMMC